MINKEFKKFPSLENTYQTKPIQIAEELGLDKQQYIVTEKVHGANFSFWMTEEHLTVEGIGLCSTVVIKCAKRSGWIEDDEKFFNYRPVLEKYRDSLERLYYHLSGTYGCNEVVVFGELYGGNIQSGMCYKEDQDFIAFDMKTDDVPVDKLSMFNDLQTYEIPCVPLLGKFDTLQEALTSNESFDSLLMREGFDGEEKHKEAEGVVIEPVQPSWFPNGSRVYFKKKTKRFLEKGGNKIKKEPETLPKELESILLTSFEYINEPRFQAVCSKIGEVTIKDIGKVMGLMTQDILLDMQKDEIEIPENKKFMKLLQTEVQTFIRPILLQKA
jgi:Rnl2 family RNA ligase